MKTKIFYFLLIAFILFSLIIPKPAFAFIDFVSIFDAALEGIEELSGEVTAFVFKIFFYYIFGLLALHTSVAFLEMAMNPDWLTLQGNPLVEYGWRFTVNIASMFLILFLIVIALSIILKIGTFDAKKSLVRLIIVALLINFTLLFVGGLLDIANVFQNTFIRGNENLPSAVVDRLGASGLGILTNLIVWIGVMTTTFVIPFVAPWAQAALVVGMVAMFPNIITWVFQLVCFFSVATLFFTYAVLFAARVFIIQILAILSPLAFLAYIFPQTKKYATMWFKFLLEWVLLGIFLFFFLVLGLAATNAFMPATGPVPLPIFGWGNIGEYVIYYFFLTVYLGVVLGVSIKLAPQGAKQIMGMTSAGLGIAMVQGAKMGKKLVSGKASRKLGEKLSKVRSPKEAYQKQWDEGTPFAKAKIIGKSTLRAPLWALRPAGRRMVATAEEAQRRKIGAVEKRLEGASLSAKVVAINSLVPSTRIGGLSATVKKGGGSKHLEKAGVTREQKKKILGDALDGAPGKFPDLRDTFPLETEELIKERIEKISKITDKKKRVRLENELKVNREKAGATFTEKDMERYDSQSDKIAAEAKGEAIAQWDKKTIERFASQKSDRAPAHFHWTRHQRQEAIKSHKRDFLDPFQEEMDRRGEIWYQEKAPAAHRFFKSNTGQALGMGFSKEANIEHKKTPGKTTPPKRGGGKTIYEVMAESEKEMRARAKGEPRGRPGVGKEPPRPSRVRPGVRKKPQEPRTRKGV